ncbi:hypothetical protein DFH11DRAFT_1539486 [Phellopilus nigrolimitatus]|nr:hypothetical protein DFH11DRAFT_1539486 [Phellopilus nigrolimitatus]
MITVASAECSQYEVPKVCHGISRIEEVTSVDDSLQQFKQMMSSTDRPYLSLHCTVPTWSTSPMHCVDLHELYDLRNRSILFLHELLRSLRSIGVQATYRLIPSNLDLATISISADGYVPRTLAEHNLLETAHLSAKGKTLLAVTENGPVIVMT